MTYVPRYPQPDPRAWDRFCDDVAMAAKMLAEQAPAQPPIERLTPEQYAVGKLTAATQELLGAVTRDRRVDDLARLPPRAWQRAAWGFADPLLVVPRFPHSPDVDPDHAMFGAGIVKLIAEFVAEGVTVRTAVEALREELQAQQAPQVADGRTMERWHRQATQQPDSHLAILYAWLRPRPWPSSAGTTLTDRVRWLIPVARP
jgi:hypothetical protein